MELREQIAEAIRVCRKDMEHDSFAIPYAVDQILALLPKPTVTIPCDKCNPENLQHFRHGEELREALPHMDLDTRFIYHEVIHKVIDTKFGQRASCKVDCACTDGKVEREIVWEWECPEQSVFRGNTICGGCKHNHYCDHFHSNPSRTLTLPDLLDPDVAWTYSNVCNLKLRNVSSLATIPRGKGVLRVKGENDG